MFEDGDVIAASNGPNSLIPAVQSGYTNYSLGEELGGALSSGRFRNMQDFRAQNPLPDVDQSVIDDVVTTTGFVGQSIIPAMINAGMVKLIPNWVGVPSVKRKRIGRAGIAHVSMVPETRGERFRVDQESDTYPLPCFWANFDYSVREEAHAARLGEGLDTTHIENATVNVNSRSEEQAIYGLVDKDGSAMKIDGLAAPGILSSTNVFDYATWTGLTGVQIVDIVNGALEKQRVAKRRGPQTLFLPGNYSFTVNKQFTAGYEKTILSALRELEYANRKLDVQIAESLPDNRVALMEMTRNTGQVVIGQQPTPISWLPSPGWRRYHMVVACMITMIVPDADGNYGVVVGDLT